MAKTAVNTAKSICCSCLCPVSHYRYHSNYNIVSIYKKCSITERSKEPEEEPLVAYLYAFDFDHTIVDQNSDSAVMEIIHDPVPENLQRMYDGTNWAEYMDKIFRFVTDEGGTYDLIASKISLLQPTTGMIPLLQRISASRSVHPHSRFIVVSDANTFFIETYLQTRNPPLFPDAIITNQADKTEEGFLKLTPYESQNKCPLCPHNLCKGDALQRYIDHAGPFTKVYYAGDGGNDICPAMKLTENDVVFVRKNYAMEKIINHGSWKGISVDIRAKIVLWEDAGIIEEEMDF